MAIGHLGWLAEVLGNIAGDSLGVECVNETSHLAVRCALYARHVSPTGKCVLSAYHKGHGSPGHDGRLLHYHSAPGYTGYAGPGNVQPMEMNVPGPGSSPLRGDGRVKVSTGGTIETPHRVSRPGLFKGPAEIREKSALFKSRHGL